jgi:Peptidase A4 family
MSISRPALFKSAFHAVGAAALVLGPIGAPALAAAPALQAPMHHAGSGTPFFISHGGGVRNATTTSDNWSGYAANGGTYTSVTTTFTQPSVKCSSGDQYSSFWVGLDGYSSDSVEQTGTEADCDGRTAEYSAWYELYPAYPVTYSNVVKPGDKITESVTFSGTSTYAMTITDTTENWTKTTTKSSSGDARSSAEVIAEAPYSGGVLPLANFGSVSFSNSTVNGSTLSASNPTGINMVADSNGAAEATISALSGGSFGITWNSK